MGVSTPKQAVKEGLMPIRNIWVYGVGGVGGVIGGRLAGFMKNHGADINLFFIARGQHLKEIQKKGLVVNTPEHPGQVFRPTLATDNVHDLPSPDLCFFCVKAYDLEQAGRNVAASISDESVVIPLLNGVDIYERLRKIMGHAHILPACIYVGTHIERPGVVTQKGGEGKVLLGRDPEHPGFYPEEVLQLLKEAGLPFSWSEDPFPAIWEKYVFIASFGLVTAVSGKTFGELTADLALTQQVRDIAEEICLIAQKKGIPLPPDMAAITIRKAGNFPPETKTSYQRDLEQAGKPNEGDLFGATIIRMGKESGIPTPVTEAVYRKILDS